MRLLQSHLKSKYMLEQSQYPFSSGQGGGSKSPIGLILILFGLTLVAVAVNHLQYSEKYEEE